LKHQSGFNVPYHRPFHISLPHDNLAPRYKVYLLLLLLLATRLVAMAVIPLTDDTEARYGEIARKMAASGNWVTLQSNFGAPFWAKPPLSTWVSAISMKWFGVSELTARLPNLLLMIAVMVMVGIWIARKRNTDSGLLAALIMGSMLLVYVVAGTVMTDTCLTFATTWSLIAFWEARNSKGKRSTVWGYLLFASFGIGMLAKGPVSIVLPGLPIFFWTLWQKDFKQSVKCLPWVGGILLMCAIFLPWYLLAEHRTPGFLHYFFIDENFKRYLGDGGWTDHYGSPHLHPMGTIIPFWLADALPWSIVCLIWLIKRKPSGWKETFNKEEGFARYLLLASAVPLVFFFFARNIIATYPLQALPPLAALMAFLYSKKNEHPLAGKLPLLALIPALVGLLAIYLFHFVPLADHPKPSQKPVIAAYEQMRPSPSTPIGYYSASYYSASFYSRNTQHQLANSQALAAFLNQYPGAFVVIQNDEVAGVPPALKARLIAKAQFPYVTLFESSSKQPSGLRHES
jgi:4-amino-4-deoxy-L-arabinose transferase-like glycosyltransferase